MANWWTPARVRAIFERYFKRTRELSRTHDRRVRFAVVSEGVAMTPRPCGCPPTNYLPNGVRMYCKSDRFNIRCPGDVEECLECGASYLLTERVPIIDGLCEPRRAT